MFLFFQTIDPTSYMLEKNSYCVLETMSTVPIQRSLVDRVEITHETKTRNETP
jgi:hypothetical protein